MVSIRLVNHGLLSYFSHACDFLISHDAQGWWLELVMVIKTL
jgi:hypothetical protein